MRARSVAFYLHVRQLHSKRESRLGQHDKTACSVVFSSVPSSSYLVWQSFTKRTKIHGVPPLICKLSPLEVVLSRQRKVESVLLYHALRPSCVACFGFLAVEFKVILISRCHRVAPKHCSFPNNIPLIESGLRILASSSFEAVANEKRWSRLSYRRGGAVHDPLATVGEWSTFRIRFVELGHEICESSFRAPRLDKKRYGGDGSLCISVKHARGVSHFTNGHIMQKPLTVGDVTFQESVQRHS